jgi:glutathione S-transferase
VTLKLYLHPLSSYCHKALIALYENGIDFEPEIIDGSNHAAFKALWPLAKFPVLLDQSRNQLVRESSIIIEYLAVHYPGPVQLIPQDADRACEVRFWDRFCDNYLHTPAQKFSDDRLRPVDQRDPLGLERAIAAYRTGLDFLETHLRGKVWITGDEFSMADCAAGPALFYGERFYGPFRASHPNAMGYLARLMARPSYARALREAQPYMHLLPR